MMREKKNQQIIKNQNSLTACRKICCKACVKVSSLKYENCNTQYSYVFYWTKPTK